MWLGLFSRDCYHQRANSVSRMRTKRSPVRESGLDHLLFALPVLTVGGSVSVLKVALRGHSVEQTALMPVFSGQFEFNHVTAMGECDDTPPDFLCVSRPEWITVQRHKVILPVNFPDRDGTVRKF